MSTGVFKNSGGVIMPRMNFFGIMFYPKYPGMEKIKNLYKR
jgi:hypothetical protein